MIEGERITGVGDLRRRKALMEARRAETEAKWHDPEQQEIRLQRAAVRRQQELNAAAEDRARAIEGIRAELASVERRRGEIEERLRAALALDAEASESLQTTVQDDASDAPTGHKRGAV